MITKSLLQKVSFFLIFGSSLLSSCNISTSESMDSENDSIMTTDDSINRSNDTESGLNIQDTNAVKKVFKDPEVQEAHKEIVKKYGEQWDLCRCIEKSDSVNKALMNASDGEFDKVMQRSDYIDKKCKDMLIHPNETPEERYAYQKKVNNCLDQAKK